VDALRRIREERGLTQHALARVSGVDPATINQVEGDRRAPTIYTLAALADGLGCDMRDLLDPAYRPPVRKLAAL
jgi:transcriptional regulator with XRE-family HTH domain